MHEAIVVGSGVIGLTSAIRLAEAGYKTRILTKSLPNPIPDGYTEMCSNAAAAVWFVYKAYPERLTAPWADQTYAQLVADYGNDCGVSPLMIRMVSHNDIPKPAWFDRIGYTVVSDDRYAHALEIELPLVEPPKYLAYLTKRFEGLGGEIDQRSIESFDDLIAENRIIVNATGLGARDLANDDRVRPIRGQVTVMQMGNPPEKGLVCDDNDTRPLYIFPRSNDIIIGGSADDGNESTDVWDDLKTHTLNTAFEHNPLLQKATQLRDVVGFRPGRDEVRLERERLSDTCTLIHNYGHGGAGFTLCWGCADTVVELAKQV